MVLVLSRQPVSIEAPFVVVNSIEEPPMAKVPVPVPVVIDLLVRSPLATESVFEVSSKNPVVEAVIEAAIVPLAVFSRCLKVEAVLLPLVATLTNPFAIVPAVRQVYFTFTSVVVAPPTPLCAQYHVVLAVLCEKSCCPSVPNLLVVFVVASKRKEDIEGVIVVPVAPVVRLPFASSPADIVSVFEVSSNSPVVLDPIEAL